MSQSYTEYRSYESAVKTSTGTPMYGMDAELHHKQQARRGDQAEREAQAWVEKMLGVKFDGSFEEVLKDGIALCELMNTIHPGSIKRINRMKQPFMQMENIESYITACREMGLKEFDLFRTVDLYEAKNIPSVVNNLHALGRACQRLPGFQGPTLGVKQAEKQTFTFTPEQLAESEAALPRLQTLTRKLGPSDVGIIDREVVRAPQSDSTSKYQFSAEQLAASEACIPRLVSSNKKLEPGSVMAREYVVAPQNESRGHLAPPPPPSSSFSSNQEELPSAPPPPPPAPEAYSPPPPAPVSPPNVSSVTQQAAQLTLDDLERLASLKDRGIISQEEFDAKKRQILGL